MSQINLFPLQAAGGMGVEAKGSPGLKHHAEEGQGVGAAVQYQGTGHGRQDQAQEGDVLRVEVCEQIKEILYA